MTSLRTALTSTLRIPLALLRLPAVLVAILLALAAWPGSSYAQNETFDLARFVRSDLRALAMGNAYGPVARGNVAMYYNPAGLVQYGFDINAQADVVYLGDSGFLSDAFSIVAGSPTPAEFSAFLGTYLGTTQSYQAQTNLSAVASLGTFKMGLGIGYKDQKNYSFFFEDTDTSGTVTGGDTLFYDEDFLDMKVMSAAFPMLDGQMLLGLTLKSFTLDRNTSSGDMSVVTGFGALTPISNNTYTASGYDVGIIWRMETFAKLRGQLSLVANNVGGMTLTGTPAYDIPASYDVGIAINPEFTGSPLHLVISAEWEDVTSQVRVRDLLSVDHERSTTQRLHLGSELGFWKTGAGNNLLSFRVGYNGGQTTYGMELNFLFIHLTYAKYGQDNGYDSVSDPHTYDALQAVFSIGI